MMSHLVADNFLLTSNCELCFSKRSDGTLNLMSTNSVPQPDGPSSKIMIQQTLMTFCGVSLTVEKMSTTSANYVQTRMLRRSAGDKSYSRTRRNCGYESENGLPRNEVTKASGVMSSRDSSTPALHVVVFRTVPAVLTRASSSLYLSARKCRNCMQRVCRASVRRT